MRDYGIEQRMLATAKDLIERRYPTGWGGAAVIRTANDQYYSSVPIETANGSAVLCIEVGAMCEAHKYRERVTHCLCVVRDDESAPLKVLSPCGICQERLRYWGGGVQVGVTPDSAASVDSGELLFVELDELQPHHWSNAYSEDELERFIEEN